MKWEYRILHQALMDKKDELGEKGWELVCYWPDNYSFIFKRLLANHNEQ